MLTRLSDEAGDFNISPLHGAGPVTFGMSTTEVRAKMPSAPKSFRRTPQASFPCDYFEAEGVFFYYDADGRLEAAEFVPPSRPSLENQPLIGLRYREAVEALSRPGARLEQDSDGAIAHGLGVGVYAPLAKDDPGAPVESVIVFRSGYYDD